MQLIAGKWEPRKRRERIRQKKKWNNRGFRCLHPISWEGLACAHCLSACPSPRSTHCSSIRGTASSSPLHAHCLPPSSLPGSSPWSSTHTSSPRPHHLLSAHMCSHLNRCISWVWNCWNIGWIPDLNIPARVAYVAIPRPSMSRHRSSCIPLDGSARAARTKYHRLGGLNNRN